MTTDMELNDHIDHQRWLLEHGFINDLHKDNLYMYGAIIHKDVGALNIDIDSTNKLIKYNLYCDTSLLMKVEKYKQLSESANIFGLWKFKRMLKKEGNLNIKYLLDRFVKDYCGPSWRTDISLSDFRDYKDEGFEEKRKQDESGKADQQPH